MAHPLITHKIGGAREAHKVDSPEMYADTAKRVMNDVGLAPILTEGQKLRAYVSAGWWVVKCETRPDGAPCGNAPAAEPEWRIAICFECGQVHEAIFPKARADGEALLLSRPDPRSRHWHPDGKHPWRQRHHGGKSESVADLRRENQVHGLDLEDAS